MGRNLLLTLVLSTAAASVSLPQLAYAQDASAKEKAKEAYKKGTIQYNLGNWDRAIAHFSEAFENLPDAAFLFNIAQAHRKAGNCSKGAFAYKRYLSMKPNAPNRDEVEGFISELENNCVEKNGTSAGGGETGSNSNTNQGNNSGSETTTAGQDNSTGTNSDPEAGGGTETSVAVADTGSEASVSTSLEPDESAGPSTLVVYAGLGAAFQKLGDADAVARSSLSLSLGYPIELGGMLLDVGVAGNFSSLGWKSGAAEGTLGMLAFMGNAGLTKDITEKIRVRGELSAGLMMYTGLDASGNGITPMGTVTDGPVSSFAMRTALGAEYALSNSLAISVQPIVLTYSPSPSAMRSEIESVTSFQSVIGVGYRM